MNILEVKNLSHKFSDENQALDNINLRVDKGEFVIILSGNSMK